MSSTTSPRDELTASCDSPERHSSGRDTSGHSTIDVTVQTPRGRPPYPVMVYIHAGEFHFGSGADRESDEPHFADDVVLVSFNYRLGVFGFLASDDLRDRTAYGGTGNYGVHDQRAALRWVFRSTERRCWKIGLKATVSFRSRGAMTRSRTRRNTTRWCTWSAGGF